MMTLGELLRENKDAIVQRWLDDALATYPADSSAAFGRQKDQFANPVGHSLRVATRGIVEALVDECAMDVERIHEYLHEVIRIRAVQEFSASAAVGFVFRLKQAVRAELAKAAENPAIAGELAKLEAEIDRVALVAFDIFVQCRERICELRVNEVKREVSWVMGKMNERDCDPEPDRIDPE